MSNEDALVWVDLETTGLKPETGRILEIAMIVTTGELQPIAVKESLVGPPMKADEVQTLDEVVFKMHHDSGLLFDATRAHNLQSIEEIDADFENWLLDCTSGQNIVLAGSTVRFDRAWIERYMPKVAARLHYRMADVSGMREFMRRWLPNFDEEIAQVNLAGRHRALQDLHDSIRLAQYFRGKVVHPQ